MEHYELIQSLIESSGLNLDKDQIDRLSRFAGKIFTENSNYNLTGFKSINEMTEGLIIGSLLPFKTAEVPRGTLFCDLGSGSGIPGIPVCVMLDDIEGILVESSMKKNNFMNEVFSLLGLNNVSAVCERAEDFGRIDGNRGKFGLVVSRAFAHEYVVIEMAAPVMSEGGSLFIYANRDYTGLPASVIDHAEELGLIPGNPYNIDLTGGGIAFIKKGITPDKYPRRYPVIKRESDRAMNDS